MGVDRYGAISSVVRGKRKGTVRKREDGSAMTNRKEVEHVRRDLHRHHYLLVGDGYEFDPEQARVVVRLEKGPHPVFSESRHGRSG